MPDVGMMNFSTIKAPISDVCVYMIREFTQKSTNLVQCNFLERGGQWSSLRSQLHKNCISKYPSQQSA